MPRPRVSAHREAGGGDPPAPSRLRLSIRPAAVSGIFYPDEKNLLAGWVDRCLERGVRRVSAVAALAPHGGYGSAGPLAGALYSRLEIPPAAVVLGPSHTGEGKPWSVMSGGVWETPLGKVEVDRPLARLMLEESPELEEDSAAHRKEHSVELQLPFLQRVGKIRSFVPVVIRDGETAVLRRIGEGIARAVREYAKPALLVVSTDLTRYEPEEVARAQDAAVLAAVRALDEEALLRTIRERSVSMCGGSAVAVGIVAAKALGAVSAELVGYRTTSDVDGDRVSVVGYAGMLIR